MALRLVPIAVIVLLLGIGYVLFMIPGNEPEVAMSQENAVECPEWLPNCVWLHEWPPFTVTYQRRAPYSAHFNGVDYEPIETVRLEWRSWDDWYLVVLESERIDLGFDVIDRTGSWERQNGRVHTIYSARDDRTDTYEVGPLESYSPDWFNPFEFSGYDLSTRTDGVAVATNTDVCIGGDCHEIGGASGTTTSTVGRQYPDEEIQNVIFSATSHRIPIGITGNDDFKVWELQVHPTTPSEDACHTNLRMLVVEETVEEQRWNSGCASEHRDGAYSHYYSFTVDEAQDTTIRAASPEDDLYIYLLDGVEKSSTVIAENDDSTTGNTGSTRNGASGASTPPLESAIIQRLEPGTYTVEVTTTALAHSGGSFTLAVEEPPQPTTVAYSPDPTPTPRPCATPLVPFDTVNPTLGLIGPVNLLDERWNSTCRSARFPSYHSMFFVFEVSNDRLVEMWVDTWQPDAHVSLLKGFGGDGEHIRTRGRVGDTADEVVRIGFQEVLPAGPYTIEVRANKPGNSVFDLTVTPVNRAPAFTQSAYTFSIPEDSPSRTFIGQVSATDPDTDALGYSLQGLKATLQAPFLIDYNGGEIFVGTKLDYETEPTITLTAVVTDAHGLTATATVTINVTDVPE